MSKEQNISRKPISEAATVFRTVHEAEIGLFWLYRESNLIKLPWNYMSLIGRLPVFRTSLKISGFYAVICCVCCRVRGSKDKIVELVGPWS